MKKRVLKRVLMKKNWLFLLMTGVCMVTLWTVGPSRTNSAEVIKWKAQSAWMPGPGHHIEAAVFFGDALNRISGGRLIIEKFHAAGEIVGAFEAIPACSAGKIDVCHGSMFYQVGKFPEAGFYVGIQASPLKSREEQIAWWWANLDLYNQYLQEGGLNIISLPCGPIEPEPVWSIKPIKSIADFKGLRIRTTGLSLDFFRRLGAATVTMPMSEVMPSLEKGVIDACEFCVPYTDYPAGIHKTCQYVLTGLIHQAPVTIELFVNRDSWNKLPDDLKQIVKDACQLTNMHFFTDVTTYNVLTWPKMVKEGRKGGLIVTKATPEMQKKFFEVGEEMAKEWSAKNPWVKRVVDSQREWNKKFADYMGTYYRLAYPEK